MLVFVRVRRQQHALVLVHIIFCLKEIIGNSLENQLIKTRCTDISYTIDNCCPHHLRRNVYCQTSIHSCVGKRCTHNLHRSSLSRSLQDSLHVLLTQPKPTHNASRPSDVCNRFWTFVASESSIVSKTLSNDSIVGMILLRGYISRLSAVHDRAIDHQIYAGSRNARTSRLLSLPPPPPPPSSSPFFSHAWRQMLRYRRATVSLSRARRLSTICCRGLIIGLKCLSNAMSSSILPVFRARCFLRIDSLDLLDLPHNFFTRAHISHVHVSLAKYRQRLVTLQYHELVKSLSVSLNVLSLSITKNPYLFCQQSRHNK